MRTIAVLFTCFNRKDKTLSALKSVFDAHNLVKDTITIKVYLTDDGSTDGTGDAVRSIYPEVNVLQGNGQLYWAGGMRNSWKAALTNQYDAYLLLNDDTDVNNTLFEELVKTHTYCINTYQQGGLYIGSTIDELTQNLSYGGYVFTNKFLAKYKKVIPNEKHPQECELGNANILLAHKDAVEKIGMLSEGYAHGMADFDYTLKAKKSKVPVLITTNVLGTCTNDHTNPYLTFHQLPLKERIKKLYHPVGLDFKSQLNYMKRNFLYRLPFVYIAGWLKVLFPKFYFNKMYKNRL